MKKHKWICVNAGMFVSRFECKDCKQETCDPHDEDKCPGETEFKVQSSGSEREWLSDKARKILEKEMKEQA